MKTMKHMKTKFFFFLLLVAGVAAGQEAGGKQISALTLGEGRVPDLATGANGAVHAAWGKGDSILYAFSANGGQTFSAPEVVGVLPKLFSFAMRGPQITARQGGACILACTQKGQLVAYCKTGAGPWRRTAAVNDADTTAKEGFLDLSGDGQNLFAAWLDIRKGRQNNIVGARSADGGKTWSANRLLYQSPDGHVCECCKPSVAVRGRHVAVLFRNRVAGSRDLWLLQSTNGGQQFAPAQKLGSATWKLNACPMDGGGLALDKNGEAQTVWRRRDTVFASAPGKPEAFLGMGRNCTVETATGKVVYAWVENGEVTVLTPRGAKVRLGKGSLPALKAVGNSVVCVWEDEKKIRKALVAL